MTEPKPAEQYDASPEDYAIMDAMREHLNEAHRLMLQLLDRWTGREPVLDCLDCAEPVGDYPVREPWGEV